MSNFESIFLIYFLYGLTFFSMGLVLLLESWRIEVDAPQKKLFPPLAVFGLLHGAHEWLEIFMRILAGTNTALPGYLLWLRLALLAGSFVALVVYSIRAWWYARGHVTMLSVIGTATLPMFALLALIDVLHGYSMHSIGFYRMAESLVRYLIGVPGAAIATIGLRASALKARVDKRRPVDVYLNLTAIGFAIYSLTQVFVPAMNTFLGAFLNADLFQRYTFVPIQVVRTVAAMIITAGSFGAVRLMETARRQQVMAAQQARLEALEQQEAMRRDLLRYIVRAQEDERTRIARELHDEMAQTLTAFSLDLATLQQTLGSRSKSAALIGRLQDLGKQMSQGMQRMVYDLRPAHLDDLGLTAALRFLAEYEGPRLKLNVDLRIDGAVHRLDSLVETVIYRIVQEALTNVARHSQTSAVCVCLEFEPQQVNLKIIDQGVGFDPDQAFTPPSGWGLAGMRERAESVGGVLRVKSAPGEGTAIEVEIPIQQPME